MRINYWAMNNDGYFATLGELGAELDNQFYKNKRESRTRIIYEFPEGSIAVRDLDMNESVTLRMRVKGILGRTIAANLEALKRKFNPSKFELKLDTLFYRGAK